MLVSSPDIHELFAVANIEVERVYSWFCSNQLVLNASKSRCMIFRPAQCKMPDTIPVLGINGESIELVESLKFLGVIIDCRLNFKFHISSLVKKIVRFLPILFKLRRSVDIPVLKTIFYSLIYPNFTYCSTVWGHVNKTTTKPLETLLNKIVRAMTGAERQSTAGPIYRDLGLLDFKSVTFYMATIYIYKSLMGNYGEF